jgi:hypothetical protein
MSYFNGPADPDDFDDEYPEQSSTRSSRARLNLGIFIVVLGVLGSTVAANPTLLFVLITTSLSVLVSVVKFIFQPSL